VESSRSCILTLCVLCVLSGESPLLTTGPPTEFGGDVPRRTRDCRTGLSVVPRRTRDCPSCLGRMGILPVQLNRRAGSPSYREYGLESRPASLHHSPILIDHGHTTWIQANAKNVRNTAAPQQGNNGFLARRSVFLDRGPLNE
jgi:hypothetical protein